MKFKFRAFYATDELETCQRFHHGHSAILGDLGIEMLTSNIEPWMHDSKQIILIAEDEEGEMVGGIRIQKYFTNGSIPLTNALGEIDPKIYDILNLQAIKGTAESCGLWNSKKVYGLGLSRLLALCSVSLSATLECQTLFCFSAPYTFKMISALGFIPVVELGNNGKYHYPTEKFISTVLFIPDLFQLKNAQEYQRNRIFSLMREPNQTCIELSGDKELTIEYNLIKSIPLNAFDEQRNN